ncbi:MAG: putative electron transport protein YccM [Syntrophorhabdaceae bacterium PtaU1.Bin034]|nr:MAG: putative electron transport protein YccM [Syntrophorhabdaceae bacterium PtaU1.Bin034]
MKINLPRISQILFFIAFLALFVTTDYRGKDEISVALNSFFRSDPLVAVSYLLSAKTFTLLLLPGLLLLLFSAILGRFFCGWICPLGTIIDLITDRIKKRSPLSFLKGNLKYYLLLAILFAALFNMNLTGILDPLAILVRFLTFAFYPLFGFLGKEGWVGLYKVLGDSRDYLEPGYNLFKNYFLPFRDTLYPLAFLSLLFFLGILVLEKFERRNWCKNLCPLGTLLGLAARFSLFRRVPGRLCADCGDCKVHCPTAFDEEILQKSDCILCLECQRKCPSRRVGFKFAIDRGTKKPFFPGRRVFVAGLVSGLFVSRIFTPNSSLSQTRLLRPPGVRDEDDFLRKCVRCGECIKVCLRSALYPVSLQAGLYGLYTPTIVPRLGYCEYNCSLCGQVCPTGAIPRLPLEEKKKAVIGKAVFDRSHCLPFAKKMNCMVCEEHCPIPEKAIRFESVDETDYTGKRIVIKRPYVVEDLCNGCGICEYVCPLEEKAGIEVFKRAKRKI